MTAGDGCKVTLTLGINNRDITSQAPDQNYYLRVVSYMEQETWDAHCPIYLSLWNESRHKSRPDQRKCKLMVERNFVMLASFLFLN